jgi:hypothetical protein
MLSVRKLRGYRWQRPAATFLLVFISSAQTPGPASNGITRWAWPPAAAPAAEAAPYSKDPSHLWNRIFRAIRSGDDRVLMAFPGWAWLDGHWSEKQIQDFKSQQGRSCKITRQ